MQYTKTLRRFAAIFALGTLLISTQSSCDKDDNPAPQQLNVVQTAQSDTTFSILVAAVVKAGLVDALSTTNNITVFAPTNNAFRTAGFTEASINALTPAQVTATLIPLLQYHVVAARVASGAVPASDTVNSLSNVNLYASRNANGVFINGFTVTRADLNASNGVIHVINGVLIPPTQTIAQIAAATPSLSLLVDAVSRGGLLNAISGPGKFTVFAPTNTAFGATPFNTTALINAAPAATMEDIVRGHVLATNFFASDIINGITAPTIRANTTLTVGANPPSVRITGSSNPVSNIIVSGGVNIIATNGVVHLVDRVILP